MNDDQSKSRMPPASAVFEDVGLQRAAEAAEKGDVARLRALQVDLNAVTPDGANLLMYEIAADNEVAVRALLQAGANPNQLTKSGASPIMAAAVNEDLRWLPLLLDHGGDPNLVDHRDEPLLTRLVFFDAWDNIQVLLDRGAKIDAAGPSGKTAVYLLGSLHQFDRVHAMLERGANPGIKTADGLELKGFVMQPVAPGSRQLEWQKKVAQKLGMETS